VDLTQSSTCREKARGAALEKQHGQAIESLGFRVNAAARALSISRSKLYILMKNGTLRFAQIDGVRIIPRSEIENLINVNK